MLWWVCQWLTKSCYDSSFAIFCHKQADDEVTALLWSRFGENFPPLLQSVYSSLLFALSEKSSHILGMDKMREKWKSPIITSNFVLLTICVVSIHGFWMKYLVLHECMSVSGGGEVRIADRKMKFRNKGGREEMEIDHIFFSFFFTHHHHHHHNQPDLVSFPSVFSFSRMFLHVKNVCSSLTPKPNSKINWLLHRQFL